MVFRTVTSKPENAVIFAGWFSYNDMVAQQNHMAVSVFQNFFSAHPDIDLVVELGTGHGGFATFLKDECDKIGARFVTYENDPSRIMHHAHEEFAKRQIDSRNINVLSPEGRQSVLAELAASKRAMILCDGGDKVSEFNTFAPHLRVNDLLLAHDYAPDGAIFERDYRNKIWNWHEIDDNGTIAARTAANLVPYYPDFNSAAWLCVIKQA